MARVRCKRVVNRLHFDDQANLYVAIIGALGMLINDKIVQASISAMNCLLTVLQRFPAPPVSNSPGFKK